MAELITSCTKISAHRNGVMVITAQATPKHLLTEKVPYSHNIHNDTEHMKGLLVCSVSVRFEKC